jgi:hypothetical protein
MTQVYAADGVSTRRPFSLERSDESKSRKAEGSAMPSEMAYPGLLGGTMSRLTWTWMAVACLVLSWDLLGRNRSQGFEQEVGGREDEMGLWTTT